MILSLTKRMKQLADKNITLLLSFFIILISNYRLYYHEIFDRYRKVFHIYYYSTGQLWSNTSRHIYFWGALLSSLCEMFLKNAPQQNTAFSFLSVGNNT